MEFVTNIQHFLNEDGSIPDSLPLEAEELLFFLIAIIETATTEYERSITISLISGLYCRKITKEYPSSRKIRVWIDPQTHQVCWACPECGDKGTISYWEGTPWDKRNYTLH